MRCGVNAGGGAAGTIVNVRPLRSLIVTAPNCLVSRSLGTTWVLGGATETVGKSGTGRAADSVAPGGGVSGDGGVGFCVATAVVWIAAL